ncbi:hypothetical protein FDO65_17060 [Nakamurella flava]|uniref:Uncharacterized protein n=1 Tax=Nakamurella flava TaxID=2576308 RepID=A0A4U6QCU0_9ACTN|nr:hypothetical protein FDO65_17060 [Nakamurella flava]
MAGAGAAVVAGSAVVAGAGAAEAAGAGAAAVVTGADDNAAVLVGAAGADDAGVDEPATLLVADADPERLPEGAPPDDVGAADVREPLVTGGVVAVSPLQADVNATAARAADTTAARAARPAGNPRRRTPLSLMCIRTPRFHFDATGLPRSPPGGPVSSISTFRHSAAVIRRLDTRGRPPRRTRSVIVPRRQPESSSHVTMP